VVRVQNVTPSSFQIKFQEWDYLWDQRWHVPEKVHWMAVERGVWDVGYGELWVADMHPTSNANVYAPDWIWFPLVMECADVVATQQTAYDCWNEGSAITERLSNICKWATTQGFSVALQEEEAADAICPQVLLGYLGFGPGTGGLPTARSMVPKHVEHHRVTTPSTLGAAGQAGSWYVYIVEEQSLDAETDHIDEDWSYIGFGEHLWPGLPFFIADMQTADGSDPCSLRTSRAAPYSRLAQEAETVELPASTLCAAACDEQGALVTLTAPASAFEGTRLLVFSHWVVAGRAEEIGQTTIEVEAADVANAVAVYLPLQ